MSGPEHDAEAWTGLRYWLRRRRERPLPGVIILAAAVAMYLGSLVFGWQYPDRRSWLVSTGFLVAVAIILQVADLLAGALERRRKTQAGVDG